ncbi:MAG TPA: TetR/AcrR family transcriptional regulator [Sporosarcina psychrophila]|uniref:TetR/AcrR family transcriptional regulator n=1 Tax=Sporosarcina psychrophila TaxID=1476 RepID=A0A921G3G6_SPOPS|nr:TetR/AcrR family transcriptional regulator [Sporosarcina psychrophila]
MREKLLKAAIYHYSRYGYQGATMQKIATEVGIKPASIYFFYQNKEALFIAAFQKLLEEHFSQMRKIMDEVENSPIEEIFCSLLHGTVSYHKEKEEETAAYISLITSPPPEIKQFLKDHMEQFDNWLIQSLNTSLKHYYPSISGQQSVNVTKQFLLLMDGIFWEMTMYDENALSEQLQHAFHLTTLILRGIEDAK